MSRPLLIAALLVAALSARQAQAAACCLSSSAFGIGRLALWEQFAVMVGTSTSPVAGRWDEQGLWQPNSPGYSENEWRAQLSALVTLHPRLQLSGRAPLLLTQKLSGEVSESNGGLGDSQLSLRFEPIYQGEYDFLPEMALTAGVTVPVGRTSALSQTDLGSDVTSRGAWVLSASATFELARNNWFVQGGGGVTFPLRMVEVSGIGQQFGIGWQATAAGGAEVRKDLVVSLVARYSYEGPIRMEQIDPKTGLPSSAVPMIEVPKSQAYDVGVGPYLAYRVNPHWAIQGGVDVGLFASGLGENRQGRVTGSLSVRYAYF